MITRYNKMRAVNNDKHPDLGKWVITARCLYDTLDGAYREEINMKDEMMRDYPFERAAELAAMDDVYELENIQLHHNGRTYKYVGWQRGMLIEFVNEFGVVVFADFYPEYDH